MGISGKLWFMGNWGLKNAEKSIILATTHMVLYPAPAGKYVGGSNLGSRSLVWLEALWKGYRGYSAATSGKLWCSGNMKSNIGCMGRKDGPEVLSVKVSHRTSRDLDLVVGVIVEYPSAPGRWVYRENSGLGE